MSQPAGHEVGYVWPGLPVTCLVCLSGCVPTYRVTDARCGFVMPEHPWDSTGECGACPGSGARVDKPVHATMARRIEDHVVEAMPPAHIPPASRLVGEIDPMKGPG